MENQKRLIVTKKWTYLLLATIPLGIIKFIYDYTQYFITSKIGFAQFGYETFVSILIILIGISAYTFNPSIGDQALVWLILNKMPVFVGIWLCVGVFAA